MQFSTKYKRHQGSKIECKDIHRTKQADKDKCDINKILKNYAKGIMPVAHHRNPIYADISDVPSYQESLNIVIRSQEQFMLLPAKLRNRFENDPVKFLEWSSKATKEELDQEGLLTQEASDKLKEARLKAQNPGMEAPK